MSMIYPKNKKIMVIATLKNEMAILDTKYVYLFKNIIKMIAQSGLVLAMKF